jgi:hypothetical protein
MNLASALRLAVYAIGLAAGVAATWAASQGLGTYDPESGVFDLHPFRVDAVVTTAVATVGNLLAGIAVWRGWGARK